MAPGLVAAGVALMALGLFASLILGGLVALPLFAAAALAAPLAFGGLVMGLAAAGTGRGRWKGLAATVASVPVGALALSLAILIVDLATGNL